MLLVNALETVCNFLLCFSFASLIDAYSQSWLLMGSVLALAFLSSLLLQRTNGSIPARLLCGLLPALGLLAAQNLTETLITAVILAFHLILTLSGKCGICYEDYKYWFGFPAVPVTALFFICLGSWPIRPTAFVCAALYLFLGVLVLRRKRMGAGAGLNLRLMNLTELAGVVILTVLTCFLLYTAMRYSEKILEYLLLPFGYLINGVIYLFDLITKLLALVAFEESEEPLIPDEPDVEPWEDTPPAEIELPTPGDAADVAWVSVAVRIALIVLAAAVLAYLLYRFYRILRSIRPRGADASSFEEGEAEPLRFHLPRRKKRKSASVLPNNEKIRQLYKEYLFFIRTCGVKITRQTTSEDVMKASGELVAPGNAERLRELYIRARYQDAEEISDAEVEQAEALVAAVKALV